MEGKKRLRGPTTKKYIKDEILVLKKNDGDGKLSAKDIRKELLKTHPGSKYIPKERAIYNIIQKNRDKVIFEPLDAPWSIGSCEKYNIPADIIVLLVEYEQSGQPKFTIRQARWFARLKPLVYEMSATKRPLENVLSRLQKNPAYLFDSHLALLAIVAREYSWLEELSQVGGVPYFDTSEIDFTIFTKGELFTDTAEEMASLVVEGFKRHLGEIVDKEESDERNK
jgi:hypothetical protein